MTQIVYVASVNYLNLIIKSSKQKNDTLTYLSKMDIHIYQNMQTAKVLKCESKCMIPIWLLYNKF